MPPEITEIPYAQRPPGQSTEQSISNPVATLPDEGAVLIANPADNMIYYLVEGTLSPAGSYQDQATLPRAVTFVDRSLRQEAPGIYSGKVRIPAGGDYQVALLLDSPRLLHCFEFTAKPGENEIRVSSNVTVKFLDPDYTVKRGEKFKLKVLVEDSSLDQPISNIGDLVVSVNMISGNWSQRYQAISIGDGVYEIELALPQTGTFNVLLNINSRGLTMGDLPRINLNVVDAAP